MHDTCFDEGKSPSEAPTPSLTCDPESSSSTAKMVASRGPAPANFHQAPKTP